MAESLPLLRSASATGDPKRWPGGRGLFAVIGTFSGATVSLQVLAGDDSTYVTVTGSAVTAAGAVALDVPPGLVRAAVASGSPSGLYADLREIT